MAIRPVPASPQFNLTEMLTLPLARLEPLLSQDASGWQLLQETASQLERLTIPLPAQATLPWPLPW